MTYAQAPSTGVTVQVRPAMVLTYVGDSTVELAVRLAPSGYAFVWRPILAARRPKMRNVQRVRPAKDPACATGPGRESLRAIKRWFTLAFAGFDPLM